MPKPPQHTLIWSNDPPRYELQTQGQSVQWFHSGDDSAFSGWLEIHTAFAFVGQAGRLSVLKEARPRGSSYWYAYHRQGQRTRKRYLGRTDQVTFARLEQEAHALIGEPVSATARPRPDAPSSELKGLLLSSKLSVPRPPSFLVERARLLTELDLISTHPLTLISASAGSGKTTLLSAWAASKRGQERGGRTQASEQALAWLSLEELDNDPIRFWDLVIAALRRCHPALGETALTLLHSPQSLPLSICLAALLQEVEQNAQGLILLLDDYHVIADQAIIDSMFFLVEHLPTSLHLVLSSRTDPDLPLSRLRVRGQLLEIRDQDLRFSKLEAASFLRNAMSLPLSEDDVSTLSQRTEGWIAGLHLAALSLRKRSDHAAFVKNFAGTHRHLLDYVQQDILAPLPESLQNFLLQTAIVPRMNAALCQAVTDASGESESQQRLQALEQANLFLVPLDEQRQWYRYHDLFREALLARLHSSHPQLVPLLHLRAARFYEARSEWREAITHALAASDHVYAASLMERASGSFWSRGETKTLHSWVFSLPDAVLCEHLYLALGAAFRFFDAVNLSSQEIYVGIVAQVEHTFTRLEALLPPPHTRLRQEQPHREISKSEAVWIEQRLLQLRALIELRGILRQNDAGRLRNLIRELDALPPDEDTHCNIIPLYLTFWLTTMYQEYGVPLLPRLSAAKQQLLEERDLLMATRVLSWSAQIRSTYAIQLHQAQQECLEALALAEQIGAHTPWEGYLYYCLFVISYAWNRLEEAPDWLQRLRRLAQNWQHMQLLAVTEIFSAQLGLARGDLAAAEEALHQLKALLEQGGLAYHAPWVTVLRVKLWLAQGKLAEAAAWAAQTTFSSDAWNPLRRWELLMLVRVLVAQQHYEQAGEMLSRFSHHLDREGSVDTVVEFLALHLLALHHAGKSAQAMCVAARLFALTEPEGHLRVYLDEGRPMHQALAALLDVEPKDDEPDGAAVAVSRPYILRLLAAFEQEEKSESSPHVPLIQASQAVPVPERAASASSQIIEPLTEREQEVLQWLSEGASNQQIANELVIQLSTVKKHVSSLLAKLGAENRTQAIAQARAASLL
ncbi:LuxR C-terminal-related transcriptional regulator [Dictyobacter kobayashii]|uniref:HTH luxR-type domain-containing protein n=1 Tax=Dictyobacter kobayashii TaxID=2014872 RepID=A0A402AZL7_9CHLR|nr:LuxR C-terminal-related transcriptional regulator [Dictyobacter kobayashii]GCE24507.1 hypothetical protein KDK_83070 [Dictyobacter kobayashii]